MKRIIFVTTLFLGSLPGIAQEKVINILKTDGTNTQTRVADLKQISFLANEKSDQGILIKTLGGETAAILFESNPVVTIANSKMAIKSSTADALEFEISDIAEIQFGDASNKDGIKQPNGFAYVMQEDGAILRGIPEGIVPQVYTLDGYALPTPTIHQGELLLNHSTLGKGIFIIKVGSFSTKIQL